MNQAHDAIRPRHRRRQEACATGEAAMPRAQQCTRVLIRVPIVSTSVMAAALRSVEPLPAPQGAMAGGSTTSGGAKTFGPTTGGATLTSGVTGNAATTRSAATGGGKASNGPGTYAMGSASAVPPPPIMTIGKQPGSLSGGYASQQEKSLSDKALSQAKTLSPERRQLRIHSAHAESPGPHSAAPAWLEQPGQWVTGVLQRRSLLAFALIIAAAVGVALMFHNHAHHADRSASESDGNAAHQQSPYPADASSTPAPSENQNLTAYRDSAASGQISGSSARASTRAAAETSWLAAPAVNTQPPRWNVPGGANTPAGGSAPPIENSPAGANMPGRIEAPPSQSSPSTTRYAPDAGQPSVYAARLERPSSADNGFIPGVNGRITGVTAFEGNINNPAQISR